jgi:hypothetical protein
LIDKNWFQKLPKSMGKITKKSIAFLNVQCLYYLNIIIDFEETLLYLNFMEKQFSSYKSEVSKLSMSVKTSEKPDLTLKCGRRRALQSFNRTLFGVKNFRRRNLCRVLYTLEQIFVTWRPNRRRLSIKRPRSDNVQRNIT